MTNNEKKFCICHKLQVATYISREINRRPKSRCPNVLEKHSENVVEIIFSFWTWMEPDWLRGMHNWRALAIFHSWQWGKCLKWWGWESILRTEHILTELLFISFKKLLFLNVYLCWSKLSERITRFAFKWWHNPTFASNCFSLLVLLFLPVFSSYHFLRKLIMPFFNKKSEVEKVKIFV